jgi:hypothetical protein
MRTFLSSHCLEKMAIPVWRSRALLAGAQQPLDFEAYGLYNAADQKVGLLCLETLSISAGQEAPLFQLLDAMLAAVQLKRTPLLAAEAAAIDHVILLMGESLAQAALSSPESLDTLRAANVHTYANRTPLIVTYHPLDLLITPSNKRKAWEDLKKINVL